MYKWHVYKETLIEPWGNYNPSIAMDILELKRQEHNFATYRVYVKGEYRNYKEYLRVFEEDT